MEKDIYAFVKSEELQYGQEIEVMENWNWCMKDHIKNSILMKHGKFIKAGNEIETKNPKRNIVYPLLNLRYRAEDIDMKDVVIYVNDENQDHLSFLIKRYHDDVYVREHDLDTFFDETKEEKIDIGGVVVRKGKDGPVHERMESIAFCDQSDIIAGPIGFKSFYSPDQLYEMEKVGWGKPENGATITMDELVTLADESKQQDANSGAKTVTPGKYIEIYRIHGSFPKSWLSDEQVSKIKEDERYVRQIHVVAFYKNKNDLNVGVTLYRQREYENPFKLHLSGRKLRNRGLAYGGVEELFDPQVWTDYSEIRKKDIIDALSKVIRWTDDPSFTGKNKLGDMDNNEMLVLQPGSNVGTLETPTANVALFNEWLKEWDELAQITSGATDALLGKDPSSGTPFRLQALVTQQGQGLHAYRRGKFATFIAEIYQDWIIPDIAREVSNGARFIATLSPDELEYVTDRLVQNRLNKTNFERVVSGELPMTDEEKTQAEQDMRTQLARRGNQWLLEILKDDFKDVDLKVKVDVAGKQKDLAGTVDKMTNVLRFVFSTYNPQTGSFGALEDPRAVKLLNKGMEMSGLTPIDFGFIANKQAAAPAQQPMQQMQQMQPQPQPMQIPLPAANPMQ